jgi:putative DNA primase/helicase
MIISVLENYKKAEDDTQYKSIGETMKRLGNAGFIKGVTEFIKGMYYTKDVELKFNQQRDLLAFDNGVLDLTTFRFREIHPTDYITVTTGYEYRPVTEVEKDKVSRLLQKIFPSIAVYDYMLKALAICLTGRNQSECFHILTGTGANGKSLLMDLCKKMLGDYFKTITVAYLTRDDNGKDCALPELVATRYARMLIASEPESRDRFQISFMKKITGNDEISCRGLYKTTIRFVAQFKLWILANDIPKFSKYDRGIERRTRCVHLPTRFVQHPTNENESKIDETLKSRIDSDESWKYGLLGLLLNTLKSLQGKSLEMPEEVVAFTEKYLLENNPVGAWLKKYYDRTGSRSDIVQRTELYNQFKEDIANTYTQKQFSEDIVKSDINSKAIDGKYYYHGIKRKENIKDEE